MRLNELVPTAYTDKIELAGEMRRVTEPKTITLVADRLGFWYGDATAAEFTDSNLAELTENECLDIVRFRDETLATGRKLVILAHPSFFSPRRAIEKKAEVYWPVDSPMASGIQLIMSILMDHEAQLQSMTKALGDLNDRIETTEAIINKVTTNMERRISELVTRVDETKRNQAISSWRKAQTQDIDGQTGLSLTGAKDVTERLQKHIDSASFALWELAHDPLLFALEGGGLLSARRAIIGPCWGPEFEPSFLRALGFEV